MEKSDLPRGIQRIDPRTNRVLRPGDERTIRDWRYRASVRYRGELWQRVYPVEVSHMSRGKAIELIIGERRDARRELETDHRAALSRGPRTGSFAADIPTYLELKREMPSFDGRKFDIETWIERFGDRARNDITATEIAQQITDWQAERIDGKPRYAPATLNRRRTALGDFYTRMNGRAGYNPLRDVPRLPEPDAIDRAQPMSVVEQILEAMDANGREFAERIAATTDRKLAADFGMHSAIRAKILAYTGMREGELKTIKATDIRFDEQVVLVRTGKGGANRRVPLNTKALAAFREFRKANLFGGFSRSSLRKAVHAACRRVKTTDGTAIPEIRPHDFRHSFATWLVNEGAVSLKTAKVILGHRDIATTARYVRASEDDARRALKRLESMA